MTQHTPGPWTADGGEVYKDHPVSPIVDYVYNSADARLIAAAPDLLAACERALSVLAHFSNDDITAQLEAAIAKAKGVQP